MMPVKHGKSKVVACSLGFLGGMICMELLMEYSSNKFQHKFLNRSSFPSSITLSQFFSCFMLPYVFAPSNSPSKINFFSSREMFASYILLSFLVFGATAFATASLLYVAYPVKIVFKSSKLIPTMVVSYIYLGKSYSAADYVSALCLSFGTALFVYDPASDSSSTFSTWGIALLVGAIICDAFVPNLQKKMLATTSAEDLMINSNLVGFILLFLYMLCSGSLLDLMNVVLSERNSTMLCMSLLGVGGCLAAAVFCYTHLIQEAGPVFAVGLATLRKVVTIVLSYVFFPKPLAMLELVALVVIAMGLGVEYMKRIRSTGL